MAAHPASLPDPAHLILGDIQSTLSAARARLPGPAALVHSDIGTGDATRNAALAAWLGETLPDLLRAGAWVIADQPLESARLVAQPPPEGVAPGRYFLYLHDAK